MSSFVLRGGLVVGDDVERGRRPRDRGRSDHRGGPGPRRARGRQGDRRGGLLGRAGIRRSAHASARTRSRGGRDHRVGRSRRCARGIQRAGGDAQHRAGPRHAGDGRLRVGARRPQRPSTSPSRAPSRRGGAASCSRRMAEMAALGVRLFTDDGTGVQNPALMRKALDLRATPGRAPRPALRGRAAGGGWRR